MIFVEQLDKIRRIRNDVTHFNRDGISEVDPKTLREFMRTMTDLDLLGAL